MHSYFLTFMAGLLLLASVGLSIVATRRVRRDPSFAPEQRSAQLWLIWLLPIAGASLVLSVLHDEPPTNLVEKDRQSQHRNS